MSAPNVPPQGPAPAPMPPAAAAPSTELPRHHVHHSYIWLESVRTIFIIAVCVVVANFSTIIGLVAEEGMGAEAGFIMAVAGIGTLVVILITFGIVAGLRVVGYKHLYFTVGPDEFTLCSGIFNKKQVHVPYQRVQSVDQRATLLQRLFGVCTVSIDTAGGAANKAVVVPYVTKAQAEWLRAELYNRKNALAAQAAVASGMGTCGLVGQIGVYTGWVGDVATGLKPAITAFDWLGLLLVCFILPAVLTWAIGLLLRRWGWIKQGDLKLDL